MKLRILHIVIATLLFCKATQAQDISKLTLPASPAFSILNYEPSAIMRPTNVKSLAADVLNSFDKDGKLLMNLGLEVTPYWLMSHPKLTMKTYLNPDVGQTVLQSLSLSAASVKDSASGDNKLGTGFRFKLHNGKPVETIESITAIRNLKTRTSVSAIINGVESVASTGGIDTRQKAVTAIISALTKGKISQAAIDDFNEAAQKIIDNYTDEKIENVKMFLTDLQEAWVDGYKELQTTVSESLYERKGLVVEVAGASRFNTTQKNSMEKIGLWGNVSYYVSADDLFTLTARYMNQNNDNNIDTSNFDMGIGYLKKTNKINVSVEGMFRWYTAEIPVIVNGQPIIQKEKDFTYRLAIQGSYTIGKDISINLNFGKDFDTAFGGSGFFTILGLNYSIFNKKPSELSATPVQ